MLRLSIIDMKCLLKLWAASSVFITLAFLRKILGKECLLLLFFRPVSVLMMFQVVFILFSAAAIRLL
jgi:hypothetical protein